MDIEALKKEARSKKTSAERLSELARHPELGVQLAVAANQQVSVETFSHLAGSGNVRVLKKLAENPATPVAVLKQLAQHSQSSVRVALCKNPHLTLELFEELSQDPDPDVRHMLVLSTQCPSQILADLARLDPDERVRSGTLTWNWSRLDSETLRAMAFDKSPLVRRSVISTLIHNKELELLQTLVQDHELSVRKAFFESQYIPAEIVTQLEQDPHPEVVEMAQNLEKWRIVKS